MPSRHVVRRLMEEIRSVERAARGAEGRQRFSTGIPPLDALLPGGGLRRGMLIEWLPAEEEGSGATLMGLVTAAGMRNGPNAECGMRNAELPSSEFSVPCSLSPVPCSSFRIPHSALRIPLVVIDRHGTFYPPAAAAWGIPLASMILLRPANARDEAWALDQAIRSPAVAAVLAWPSRLDDRAFRRLQLAAESSGTIGVLVRPASAHREPTWADVRCRVGSAHHQKLVGGAHPTDFRLQISDFRLGEADPQIPNPKSQVPNLHKGWLLSIECLHARGCMRPHEPVRIEITPEGAIHEITPEERSSTGAYAHVKPPLPNLKSAI